MKRNTNSGALLVLILISFPLLSRGVEDLNTKGREKISDLTEKGREKQRSILERFQKFTARVEQSGGPARGEWLMPVSLDDATGIEGHDRPPGVGDLPEIFAYLRSDSSLFSEADETKERTGGLKRGEKVEVIYQIQPVSNKSLSGKPWSLIRKANGKEGYVKTELLSSEPPGEGGGKDFVMPVKGRISSGYGPRIDPVTGKRGSFHAGLDIACPEGTPIYAAMNGVVKKAYYSSGYGNLMILEHKGEVVTYYAHQSRFAAKEGSGVKRGDRIGFVGSTGKATGPHLHFEVRKGGKPLDPSSFVPD